MAIVWIRRGFRWVASDLTDVPAGQYYVTEPPTEAHAIAEAEQVAKVMASEPYTPRGWQRRAQGEPARSTEELDKNIEGSQA